MTTSQDYRDKSREAFELWKDLFQMMKESNSATLDVQETLDITTEMLISYETWEVSCNRGVVLFVSGWVGKLG